MQLTFTVHLFIIFGAIFVLFRFFGLLRFLFLKEEQSCETVKNCLLHKRRHQVITCSIQNTKYKESDMMRGTLSFIPNLTCPPLNEEALVTRVLISWGATLREKLCLSIIVSVTKIFFLRGNRAIKSIRKRPERAKKHRKNLPDCKSVGKKIFTHSWLIPSFMSHHCKKYIIRDAWCVSTGFIINIKDGRSARIG